MIIKFGDCKFPVLCSRILPQWVGKILHYSWSLSSLPCKVGRYNITMSKNQPRGGPGISRTLTLLVVDSKGGG